jgi:hypothetical protein
MLTIRTLGDVRYPAWSRGVHASHTFPCVKSVTLGPSLLLAACSSTAFFEEDVSLFARSGHPGSDPAIIAAARTVAMLLRSLFEGQLRAMSRTTGEDTA